jgi:hypothetical protein
VFQEGSHQLFRLLITAVAIPAPPIANVAGDATATTPDPRGRDRIVKRFPNTSLNAASPNNLTRNWSHA